MMRVLIVEDNHDLAFGLRNNLEIEGYSVDVADDGPAGLASVRQHAPDLVILDLMLPGMDGYRVLRQMRAEGFSMPVLILTARGEEADKVLGFRLGADDYVTKPFGVLELLARVEALLRRARADERRTDRGIHRFGGVEVEMATRIVRRNRQVVPLTPMEFDLLVALLQRNGAVVSRLELLTQVWGHASDVHTRTIDTHIGELRRKLEDDPSSPQFILTVRKAGYRLAQDGVRA
jgi:two-component system, OmpR family, alkaline phosphatase synthesis response regulator PhoP